MMAEVKIHESALEKVKVGMPAFVRVDAAAGRTYEGEVAKIALLPDAQSWWSNPDLKVYNSEIHITGDASDLRAGMSCRTEIIVEVFEDAVYIPVQSVVREGGQPTVYVYTGDGEKPRAIEIGLDNNRMVRVLSGLEAGEKVLLAPPLGASTLAPVQGEESEDETETPAEASPARGAGEERTGRTEGTANAANSKPESKPEAKPTGGSDAPDWRNMSAEERRKAYDNLSPEQKRKLREQFGGRRNGGRGGGERGGGADR
jgi:HlyD family secretion protein